MSNVNDTLVRADSSHNVTTTVVTHSVEQEDDRRPRGSRHRAGPVMAWERRYRTAVITGDVLVTLGLSGVAAVLMTYLFGSADAALFAVPTAAAVLVALPARRAWQPHILGQGAEEYHRVGLGMLTGAVTLLVFGALFSYDRLRPWVFLVVPAIALALIASRYVLRRGLHAARKQQRCLLPVIAAGSRSSIADMIERTRNAPHVGWQVEGACVVNPSESGEGEIDGVPVVGGLETLSDLVRRNGYRVVAVTPDAYWTPQRVQTLAWDLEGTSAELVVAPTLMEIGRPRLWVSGVLGMPMLRLTQPKFNGWQRLVKEVIDRVGAFVLLTLIAPVLTVIAAGIKLTGRGPVFYTQERVMRDGMTFRMIKFRTMRVDADAARQALAGDNEAAGPLFKMRNDPRVTAIGRILRRYSLDELPQLFNVLFGHMSLVGPRPPLPEETASYDSDVGRRLLVKPGMTGLWQVSGRSDLSWEQSVRLDLRYVEDWSLTLDAVILWKTVRAVVTGEGAY